MKAPWTPPTTFPPETSARRIPRRRRAARGPFHSLLRPAFAGLPAKDVRLSGPGAHRDAVPGARRARRAAAFGKIDVVVSPALGGIVPGYETARWLGAKAIFVEREDGVFKLRRGFAIAPGARVLMVEDIITDRPVVARMPRGDRRASRPHRRRRLPDRPLGRQGGYRRAARRAGDARHSRLSRRRAAARTRRDAGDQAGQPRARRHGLEDAARHERRPCASASTSITSRPCATRAAARCPIPCARR